MFGWTVILVVQAVCAIVGVETLRRCVYPALRGIDAGAPSVVLDVWVPLVIVGPLLFVIGRLDANVVGAGWTPVGGPVCVGLVGLGMALRTGDAPRAGAWALGAAAGAGLLLLLLGAAHDLSIWTGQVTFALAAVVLWMNTPVPGHATGAETPRVAAGVLIALVCAVGQGVCAVLVPERAAGASIGLLFLAGGAAAFAARGAGGAAAARIAIWTAGLGPLLAIGFISLVRLAPMSARIVMGEEVEVTPLIAHGFGAYAFEAVMLMVMPAVVVVAGRLDGTGRRRLGLLLALAAVAVAAWRVAGV
jgi:hypothetical protein